MLFPNGLLDWITSSISIHLRMCPVVVLLSVGQVSQYYATAWIIHTFLSALTSCMHFWVFPSIFYFLIPHRFCTKHTESLNFLYFARRLTAFIGI